MSLKEKFSYCRSTFRRYGVIGFLTFYTYLIIKKVLKIEYRKSLFFRADLNNTLFNSNLIFEKLSLSDFEKLRNSYNTYDNWFSEIKIKRFREWLRSGSKEAFGNFQDKILTCYGWINYNVKGIGNVKFQGKDVYIFDDYTSPQFRGKGYQRDIIHYRMKIAAEKGYDKVWAEVYSFNKASIKNYINMGFTPLVTMRLLKIGKRKPKYFFSYKNALLSQRDS